MKRSPGDQRDWSARNHLKIQDIPDELDLRDKCLKVRDQGKEGACGAFVACCIKEWQENKEEGLNEYCSHQFIYSQRSDTKSSGMYPREIMKILHKKCMFKYF